MAAAGDPRSLLRAARLSRRIDHPQAIYSKSGALQCAVCQLAIKSDALWEGHLRSKLHVSNAQRSRDGLPSRPADGPAPAPHDVGVKKRKADDSDDGNEDRKRTKEEGAGGRGPPVELPRPIKNPKGERQRREEREQADGAAAMVPSHSQDGTNDSVSTTYPLRPPSRSPDKTPNPARSPGVALAQIAEEAPTRPTPNIDEDEWAAFEREIATASLDDNEPGPPTSTTDSISNAITAPSTYSAPAVSAAELAKETQKEERQSAQRAREAELEGDREDAARQLETEFEEMEGLEERVRVLRERRELLRRAGGSRDFDAGGAMRRGEEATLQTGVQAAAADEESDEDDASEEDDAWGLH